MKLFDKIYLKLSSDKAYYSFKYKLICKKKMNWTNPKSFDEKIQVLKLKDRKEEYSNYADKIKVKDIVSNLIGEEYVIKTLGIYNDYDDIDFDNLPDKFVIKCNHDSGGIYVCENKNDINHVELRKKFNQHLKCNYYKSSREWPYKNIKPKLFIEEYLNLGKGNEHFDYKFMCFNGCPKYLFLDIGVVGSDGGHAEKYFRNIYNMDFDLLPYLETRENFKGLVRKPENFNKMIDICKILSQHFIHCRVDLYNVNGKIYFGELTFYHGSGYNKFIPEDFGKKLGDDIDLTLLKK